MTGQKAESGTLMRNAGKKIPDQSARGWRRDPVKLISSR
jgi:hypothetical protein